MNRPDIVKRLRHMTGGPSNGSPVLDLRRKHIFLDMPCEPEQKWQKHEQHKCQAPVPEPDHRQNADDFTRICKHADNAGCKQVLDCVHIPDKP